MEKVIKLPDIGEGVVEAEIIEIFVSPNQKVSEDEALLSVMTDKAAVEIPSPIDGIVSEIFVKIGDILPVGTEIIKISALGEKGETNEKNGEISNANIASNDSETNQKPKEETIIPKNTQKEEKKENIKKIEEEVINHAEHINNEISENDNYVASPSVRRRARDMGLDLAKVNFKDKNGRISHLALDKYIEQNPQASLYSKRSGRENMKLIGMRRLIAEKMEKSYRNIPHFAYVEEFDLTELIKLRSILNKDKKITFLPFFMKAICNLTKKYPMINGHYDETLREFTRFNEVNIGIATASDNGLLVPVVFNAESLTIEQSALMVDKLTNDAKNNNIDRKYLSGSTITITSLGKLGGVVSTPIINSPEVAIIGINKLCEKVTFENGVVGKKMVMNISSSFDHRIIDGYVAASFISDLKLQIENPALLFID